MKAAVWIVFALLSGLWLLFAAATAAVVGWVAANVNIADAESVARAATDWPIPAWLSMWVDTAWLQMAQQAAVWAIENMAVIAPWLSTALGWLVPLIWVVWALVQILMLVLAVLGHVLVNRKAQIRGMLATHMRLP